MTSLLAKAQVNPEDFNVTDVREYAKWNLDYKRKVFNDSSIAFQNLTLLNLGLQDSDKNVRFGASANAVYFFSAMQEARQKEIKVPYKISLKDLQGIQESLIKNIDDPDENIRIASVKALLLSDARSKKIESLLLKKLLTDPSSEVKREIIEGMLKVGYNSPELLKMSQTFEIGAWNTNQASLPTQSLVTPD